MLGLQRRRSECDRGSAFENQAPNSGTSRFRSRSIGCARMACGQILQVSSIVTMADRLSPARRSANMAAIRSKNMKPELAVRKVAHALGYRYRLHRKDVPGKPDLVFGPRRKIIFVHGCFWHLHPSETCRDARVPASNTSYGEQKLGTNIERDAKDQAALIADSWKVLIIWECETTDPQKLARRLKRFLGPI